MLIIQELFNLGAQATIIDTPLYHTLADYLLSRLHDEDLASRVNASQLFVHMPLEYVLPKLVSLELHKNDTIRAAAHKSILNILLHYTDSPVAVMKLIDTVK